MAFDDADLAEDLNGELFRIGSEGEIEEDVANRHVLFRENMPRAAQQYAQVEYDADEMKQFLNDNASHYVRNGGAVAICWIIALLRFYAARVGLISPDFDATTHHVRYNDAKEFQIAAQGPPIPDGVNNASRDAQIPRAVRERLRKRFSDLVCMLAFVFRVRGHHFLAGFETIYDKLWIKCLYPEAEKPTYWADIMVCAFHAIMPDALDGYWGAMVAAQTCSGALIKRFHSAAAGTAAPFVVLKGIDDVRTVFPGIVTRIKAEYEELKRLVALYRGNRWKDSVNARYYGATRDAIDESRFAAMASIVLGVYTELAKTSPLRASPALQRLAQNAPVIGGALGIAAMRAIGDTRMSLITATEEPTAP